MIIYIAHMGPQSMIIYVARMGPQNIDICVAHMELNMWLFMWYIWDLNMW